MSGVGVDLHEDSLARAHVRPMDVTGRPLRGDVFVDAHGIRTAARLRFRLDRCKTFVATLPPKTGARSTSAHRATS